MVLLRNIATLDANLFLFGANAIQFIYNIDEIFVIQNGRRVHRSKHSLNYWLNAFNVDRINDVIVWVCVIYGKYRWESIDFVVWIFDGNENCRQNPFIIVATTKEMLKVVHLTMMTHNVGWNKFQSTNVIFGDLGIRLRASKINMMLTTPHRIVHKIAVKWRFHAKCDKFVWWFQPNFIG